MQIEVSTSLHHARNHTVRAPRADKGKGPGKAPDKRIAASRTRQFVAWDGEGYTDPATGVHHYALFGNNLGARATGRVDWRQAFRLLFEAPANAHHVIFAGTYDVVMLFRHRANIVDLLHGKPCFMENYKVTFLRGKMLRITDRELKQTRTLYDVFTFFGVSFVKACAEYLGSSTVLDEIAVMKEQRNLFTKADFSTGKVDAYMSQELELLVALCTSLRDRLSKVNIHPHQWHGPGAVASTVLKNQGIKPHKGNYDDHFRRVAESAYYGGRFEQFKRGTYEGTVYQYDIRSAYPDAMRYLPSLLGAEWHHQEGSPVTVHPFGLYRVDHQETVTGFDIGRLPHRNDHGAIYFPPSFSKGWYWGIELGNDAGWNITEHYKPVLQNLPSPFQFVTSMYDQRAKLKRANQPQQLALKLALNSLYGKLAQSKGASANQAGEWSYPTFHEVVWAGLITATTRRKISDGLHSIDPASIIATETDSIFSLEPLPVDVGPGLGQWDCEVLEGIKYIQSGVSLVKQNGEWSFKTRGFTVKRTENEVQIWSEFLAMEEPCLTVKQTRFGTDPRQRSNFGTWYQSLHNLRLDANVREKRIHSYCPACDTGQGYNDCLHSLIVPPIPVVESTPYQFIWRDPDAVPSMVAQLIELGADDPTLKLEYT